MWKKGKPEEDGFYVVAYHPLEDRGATRYQAIEMWDGKAYDADTNDRMSDAFWRSGMAFAYIPFPEFEDRPRTNMDRVREMEDEELIRTFLNFMGNAAACPDCFRRNGEDRVRWWMAYKVKEGT